MLHARAFVLVSGASLLSFAPALAQDIPSSYRFVEHSQEAGLFVGVASLNAGQLGLGPKSADVFGGRYSVSFGSALAFEGDATYFRGTRDVIDIRADVDERVLGESPIDLVAIEARFRLNLTGQRTWRRLQPFLAVGGGMALSGNIERTLEDEASVPILDRYDFGSKFIASLTVGTHLHLTSRLVLRVDGVMNLWKVSTPSGWLTTEVDLGTVPEDEWVSAHNLSLGASWRF